MHSKSVHTLFSFILAVIISFCTAMIGGAQTDAVYKFESKHDVMAAVTNGIIYEEEEKGTGVMRGDANTEGSNLAMITDANGNTIYLPDALGSTNITIKVNKVVGYTTLAGLLFKEGCKINIWKDGTIEVDRVGVNAVSQKDTSLEYISKKINIEGENKIVMVANK